MSWSEMLRGLPGAADDDDDDHSAGQLPEAVADNLKAAFAEYQKRETFAVGDLVTQKAGPMVAYKRPKPGMPAIVTALTAKPDVPARNVQERDPDITIGVIVQGSFERFTVESCRFTKWKP